MAFKFCIFVVGYMLKQTGLDWHRFSKEKGEDFREEEGVKVDLAMTKDCMVAVRDEATQM